MTATLVSSMGAMEALPGPENVTETLLKSLLETFTATRDLHKTLRVKEKRDHEAIKMLKGYPDSRHNYCVERDDMDTAGEDAIRRDEAAVKREFQRGYDNLGLRYADGDVITQTELQAQIIALQATLITVFLYGPTSSHPISHHLTTILSASRTASSNAVKSLAAQYQRMLTAFPPPPLTPYSATLPPASFGASTSRPRSRSASRSRPTTTSTSTALVPSRYSTHNPPHRHSSHHPSISATTPQSAYPSSTSSPTALSMPMPQPPSRTSPSTTSTSVTTYTPALFCPYALELQHHPSRPLGPSFASSTPYCPSCDRTLNLTPGRTWEVRKTVSILPSHRGRRDSAISHHRERDSGKEQEVVRVFHLDNRFVIKCHRPGKEGGYGCVLCTRDRGVSEDTVAGDVKALVRHVWMEHGVGELEGDEDVREVVDDGRRWEGCGRVSRRSL